MKKTNMLLILAAALALSSSHVSAMKRPSQNDLNGPEEKKQRTEQSSPGNEAASVSSLANTVPSLASQMAEARLRREKQFEEAKQKAAAQAAQSDAVKPQEVKPKVWCQEEEVARRKAETEKVEKQIAEEEKQKRAMKKQRDEQLAHQIKIMSEGIESIDIIIDCFRNAGDLETASFQVNLIQSLLEEINFQDVSTEVDDHDLVCERDKKIEEIRKKMLLIIDAANKNEKLKITDVSLKGGSDAAASGALFESLNTILIKIGCSSIDDFEIEMDTKPDAKIFEKEKAKYLEHEAMLAVESLKLAQQLAQQDDQQQNVADDEDPEFARALALSRQAIQPQQAHQIQEDVDLNMALALSLQNEQHQPVSQNQEDEDLNMALALSLQEEAQQVKRDEPVAKKVVTKPETENKDQEPKKKKEDEEKCIIA